MYTLEQLNGRIIWLFRQPRSGSTWFQYALKNRIGRKILFMNREYNIDGRVQQPEDTELLLSTHNFNALERIHEFTNPIIFCIDRKNHTEQFISNHIASHTKIFNVNSNNEVINFPFIKPFTIPLRYVRLWSEYKKYRDSLWNKYALNYENEVVYYEDLLKGWNSKLISSLYFSMGDTTYTDSTPRKLPYDKKDIILNYNTIDTMIKNEFGEY